MRVVICRKRQMPITHLLNQQDRSVKTRSSSELSAWTTTWPSHYQAWTYVSRSQKAHRQSADSTDIWLHAWRAEDLCASAQGLSHFCICHTRQACAHRFRSLAFRTCITQAFPYFYVPYDIDFPTDPVQGDNRSSMPGDTGFRYLAELLSAPLTDTVGLSQSVQFTKQFSKCPYLRSKCKKHHICEGRYSMTGNLHCSASICAPLCTCPGECDACWARDGGPAPPASIRSAARPCNALLWVLPGRGPIHEDRHVRPGLRRPLQLYSNWQIDP